MASKRKTPIWVWGLIIIFVILFIIIYIGSLGKVNLGNSSAPEEFKDDKEQAKKRRNKLKALIERRETLQKKIDKRFKLIYFIVRCGFIALWAAYIFGCHQLGWVQNLGDILNLSEAAILVWVALNFLTFGNLSSLNGFIDLIKMKLENWIWGKYVNINQAIETNKKELKELKSA